MDTSCEIGFTCAILLYASAILLSAADQLQYLDGTLTILTVKMASGRAFEPLSEAHVTCPGGQDSHAIWPIRLGNTKEHWKVDSSFHPIH